MLDTPEKLLISDFLGEYFSLFVARAAERGYTEEEAEKIIEQILED